ncbi:class I SAM-dependent methyltransferase [Clostridium massiliamazoniense]|uniref:class I SAM-dependent methyltransferase n=1 Tax=Clostridium massiliamazoniense TaxID=1347366 RepID=UPI0006D792F6|nr:class I SAM-dependent methyltransferase [Clostridium massiliamazoniense]
MDKMKEFFNNLAADWDNQSKGDPEKIERILKTAELKDNSKILDIACGTGVLEEFLLPHNPNSILAVDLSEKMIEKAKSKYDDFRITFLCENIFNIKDEKFDFIIIYNAFPHFLEPEKFINHISTLLNKDGQLVICHGMGRKPLNDHHKRTANEISLGLKPASEVAELISSSFTIKNVTDEEHIYIVYGTKK